MTEKTLKRSTWPLIALLVWLFGLPGIGASQSTSSTPAEKREADKAWEALVKAKGGREKLYSVTNMLTKFSDVTRLQIFPCSRWRFTHWLDLRPFLEVYNEKNNTRYWAGKSGVERIDNKDFREECLYDQIPFLLETNWYKPTPIGVKREKIGKKSVDVIDVLMGSARLDFVYDPEEMLVTEVRFLSDDRTPYQRYRFSEYVDINGIKMPRTFKVGISAENFEPMKRKGMPISFAFNVDYDPKIFDPPFIATSADAWKRKQ